MPSLHTVASGKAQTLNPHSPKSETRARNPPPGLVNWAVLLFARQLEQLLCLRFGRTVQKERERWGVLSSQTFKLYTGYAKSLSLYSPLSQEM